MSKTSNALLIAKEVYEQGGNLNTRLGSNCPTIGQVIRRALVEEPNDPCQEELAKLIEKFAERLKVQLDEFESMNAARNARYDWKDL